MADEIPISGLSPGTTLAAANLLPSVQSGVTNRITGQNVLDYVNASAQLASTTQVTGLTGSNQQSSAVNVTLTNPMTLTQAWTFTTTGKALTLAAANAANSVPLGSTVKIINDGANSFDVKLNDGTTIISGLKQDLVAYFTLEGNSTAAGDWGTSFTGSLGIQQANAVAITAGTITGTTFNNGVIGGSTPAAGTFTTLKGTNTTLGDRTTNSNSSTTYSSILGGNQNSITSATTGGAILTGALNSMTNNCSYSVILNGQEHVLNASQGSVIGGIDPCAGLHHGLFMYNARVSTTLTSTADYQWMTDMPNGYTLIGATFTFQDTLSGSDLPLLVSNLSNTASSTATITAQVAGSSASDPRSQWIISGVTTATAGLDNSDSAAFVLSFNANLGTNNVFRIGTDGTPSFPLVPLPLASGGLGATTAAGGRATLGLNGVNNTATGTTYTAAAATDAYAITPTTNGSAVAITINDSSFSTGDEALYLQNGAGQVTFTADGGVSFVTYPTGLTKIAGQGGACYVKKLAANSYFLKGDLTS